jgi:hypothetical protein
MAPIWPTEEGLRLDPDDRSTLLATAGRSIQRGVKEQQPLRPEIEEHSSILQAPGASFVTLHLDERLRGCIGSLEARRALVVDVAEHAWAAAFEDPRFAPVSAEEASGLKIHISVLSEPVPVDCANEGELIARLRPGLDGLILEEGAHRATFLPSVWAELQDPHTFLRQLKSKASLPPHHWSETLRFYRYTTETFPC